VAPELVRDLPSQRAEAPLPTRSAFPGNDKVIPCLTSPGRSMLLTERC
jgi:hypothetical protein